MKTTEQDTKRKRNKVNKHIGFNNRNKTKNKKPELSELDKKFINSEGGNKKLRTKIAKFGNDKNHQLILFEPGCFDGGIIRYGKKKDGYAVVYDYEKTAEALALDYLKFNSSSDNKHKIENYGFDEAFMDACEWLDYNTIRSIPYIKNGSGVAPIVVYTDEDGVEQIA